MKYRQLKDKQAKKINDFTSKYAFFAFNAKQFNEGLEQLGLPQDDYKDKLSSLVGGGYILKTKEPELNKIFQKNYKQLRKFLSKYKNLIDALEYEMCNYECAVSGEYLKALFALGITMKKFNKNSKIRKAFWQARKNVHNWYMKHN